MGFYQAYGKRVFDLCVSVSAVAVFAPLFVIITFLYIVTLSFPVLYAQQRIGHNNHVFELLKFRSLRTSQGSLQLRRFLLGDMLRFTSLDELPQLFQVIAGKMSCCGPRPLPIEYQPLFSETQNIRHTVRPGITGWAQVNGRHSITWPEKLSMDVYYANHVSFMLDLKILLKTLIILFSLKKDVSLSEEKFNGEN